MLHLTEMLASADERVIKGGVLYVRALALKKQYSMDAYRLMTCWVPDQIKVFKSEKANFRSVTATLIP
jgi:hypothetical protein